MKFEEGQLVILNNSASNGLPNRVGEVAEIVNPMNSPNYQYLVRFEDLSISPVKEKELFEVTEEQLQLMTYIKRNNKVIYSPLDEEVEIVKTDFIHGQAEIRFKDLGRAMTVVGFESLKSIENKEEETVNKETVFTIGDKVRTNTGDHWGGLVGIISGIQHYDDGTPEYLVDINDKIGCPFSENELELHIEETINGHTKEYWLDLFFGHYDNGDDTFTLPKDLLHNLLDKLI